MKFSENELNELKQNSFNVHTAIALANQMERDSTVGGIFPKGESRDFSVVDRAKFEQKWCKWWPLALKLLSLAKAFTGPKGDAIIDALIEAGDEICK